MACISVVVPAYNEEEALETAYKRLNDVLKKMIKIKMIDDYEIIFVNDGSVDNTWNIIKEINKENAKIKGIHFSKNFGLQSAYTAGLERSKGDHIVMIDCDLQDPPELIEDMYKKMVDTDCDVVFGKRTKRKENIFKRALFNLFHKIFSRVSAINAPADVGNFSMLNRKALDAFLLFKEKTRYMPGLRFFIGFKQEFVEYERKDREAGEPKMSFSRLLKLAMDAIFSFSDIPIRLCFYLGSVGVVIFLIAGIIVIIKKFVLNEAILGWSSILLSIFFLGSVQLLFLGILGQYIFRIYKETQNRPIYIISELLGDEHE